jgi:acyl-CoA thioesterase-1
MDHAGGWRIVGREKGRMKAGSKGYGVRRRTINCFLVACGLLLGWGALDTIMAADAPQKLLVLGDSLAAGYGLPADQGFTVKLGAALRAAGRDVAVVNAGVSGDTSAGGLARLDWSLADDPNFAIIELGANDGLRGLDPAAMAANLDAILTKLGDRHIPVLLAGMYAPRNLGSEYDNAFDRVFASLAEKHGVLLYPFFLDGVATDPALNQADGMHPSPAGVDVIVAKIMPYVTRLLDHQRPKSTG